MMSDFVLSSAYFFWLCPLFYILERKNGKCPYKYRKNNNAANYIEKLTIPTALLAMFTVCITLVDLHYTWHETLFLYDKFYVVR
jgi:hypothetical protein